VTDLGTQIADLILSIDFEDAEQGYEAFSQALEDIGPLASRNDIACAQKILENGCRAELMGGQASVATVRRMFALIRKAIPDGIRFAEAIPKMPATGSSGVAIYLVEHIDWCNPFPIAWMAMFRAAVKVHNMWEPAGPGWYVCFDADGPHGTPQSLVDSLPIAFPRAMLHFEQTVRRGRGHA
jgi:hypothetical protein